MEDGIEKEKVWMHTGDEAEMDGDSYVRSLDASKI